MKESMESVAKRMIENALHVGSKVYMTKTDLRHLGIIIKEPEANKVLVKKVRKKLNYKCEESIVVRRYFNTTATSRRVLIW